jgi:hypothetical protein
VAYSTCPKDTAVSGLDSIFGRRMHRMTSALSCRHSSHATHDDLCMFPTWKRWGLRASSKGSLMAEGVFSSARRRAGRLSGRAGRKPVMERGGGLAAPGLRYAGRVPRSEPVVSQNVARTPNCSIRGKYCTFGVNAGCP